MILRATPFSEIAGWNADAHEAALDAFLAGVSRMEKAPPKTRQLGIDGAALREAARAARHLSHGGRDAARAFFERYFAPHRIEIDGTPSGFVTGYYEPEVAASLTRTDAFDTPLYRRPDDLIEIAASERPPDWNPEIEFGRRHEDRIVAYHDRAAIEAGALAGRGLELAWLADPVEAFFIHVQGSARLRLQDGRILRVGYDGKSGHAYTSIGRLAVERNILSKDAADKDGLEAWLKAHPAAAKGLMQENRSFIFFRQTEADAADGPIGVAGIPLCPGRSLAIDRMLHTFHTPIWVEATSLTIDETGKPFRRLVIAHDTGSAIVGPARGDIFVGSGQAAGSVAGGIRHAASMTVLMPKAVDAA